MNCPKCNYPDGPGPNDHFKGLYTPGKRCNGCGYEGVEAKAKAAADDISLCLHEAMAAALRTEPSAEECLRDALRAAVASLLAAAEALDQAANDWEECALYKSDYLAKKHGDAEGVARARAAAAAARTAASSR